VYYPYLIIHIIEQLENRIFFTGIFIDTLMVVAI